MLKGMNMERFRRANNCRSQSMCPTAKMWLLFSGFSLKWEYTKSKSPDMVRRLLIS